MGELVGGEAFGGNGYVMGSGGMAGAAVSLLSTPLLKHGQTRVKHIRK